MMWVEEKKKKKKNCSEPLRAEEAPEIMGSEEEKKTRGQWEGECLKQKTGGESH